jgi:hypothetical protein
VEDGAQHRAVDLAQQAIGDVHDGGGVDAQQVAIERQVVDRAQREAVDDGSDSFGLGMGRPGSSSTALTLGSSALMNVGAGTGRAPSLGSRRAASGARLGAQRPVVALVDRAGAVGGREQRAALVVASP